VHALLSYCSLCVKMLVDPSVYLVFVLRKKKVKEDMKRVDGHVPSSSVEMSDTARATAPILACVIA